MKKSYVCKRHTMNSLLSKVLPLLFIFIGINQVVFAQQATSSIPIGLGRNCGGALNRTDSVMYFSYNRNLATINRMSTCKPILAAPGLSTLGTGISFNPADQYLYVVRSRTVSGVTTSYLWRWDPNTCPTTSIPVYQTYANTNIAGLDFDGNGMGYQVIFTLSPSGGYDLALQQIDFSTGTFGPLQNIDLQGKKIYFQNGDLVITPGNQFLMVWNNKYFSLNYEAYGTSTPLVATYIDSVSLPSTVSLVGLAYAQGKLIGSAAGNAAAGCGFYDFNIINGKLTNLTEGPMLQFSVDLTNITSGVGAAKKLVSATPVSTGVYDLTYDIRIENFGDFPINNLALQEDLTTIHPLGAAAISNISTEWVQNPSGIVKSATYDGITDKNLISSGQVLPNFPKANNYAIIRVKFRMSSVETGVVYYNNANVTGRGYNNVALQDSSTNGSYPDLNSNYKPDDAGESQPTPFSVSIAAETPPCTSIYSALYSQDFGTATTLTTTLPTGVTTEYGVGTNPLDDETYIIASNAFDANNSKFVSLTDHTGGGSGGMFVINADVNNYKIFEKEVDITCVNVKYSFLIYVANIMNDTYNTFCNAFGGIKQPKITLIVRNADNNNIIATTTTASITDRSWNAYGMKWIMPVGVTKIKLQVYNTAEGGCGNALALDDIEFGICDPSPVVSAAVANIGCPGQSSTLIASISDTSGMGSYLQYQWQNYLSATSGWTDITEAVTNTYDAIIDAGSAVQPSYRIVVAADGNLGNAACQFISNDIQITLKDSSVQSVSVTSNKTFACPGEPVTLSVNGGSLGTNAVWEWRLANCNGTLFDTGSQIVIYPLATTNYYVRAAGDCNITACSSITMPQHCILGDESVMLRGSLNNRFAHLIISIIADKQIKFYEIERSFNGIDYTTIKTENINDYVNKDGYSFKDVLSAVHENTLYYRVKVTGFNSEVFMSKVLQLSHTGNDFGTTVTPNPSSVSAKVSFTSASSSRVTISLVNAMGQYVRKDTYVSVEGLNVYTLNGLNNISAGIYTVIVTDSGKTSRTKLVIQR